MTRLALAGHLEHLALIGAVPIVLLVAFSRVRPHAGTADSKDGPRVASYKIGFGAAPPVAVRPRVRSRPDAGARTAVAFASFIAAAIHGAVVPHHLQEAWLFGLFFLVTAGLQLWWGIAVQRDASPRLLAAGAAGSALLAALWIVSRTAGLPIGVQPWRPEAVGAIDVVATAAEILIVAVVMQQRRAVPR